ncbi:hypothetical protein M5E88_16925 [Akkermansia muciniphila]|nr:hypothetical protein M5E88_16925 [Akkermansia muciniphila]
MLISPQWVVVDKMMGTIWDGTFTGRVLAQIDDGDALNGSFVLQDMNLTSIGKSYDKKMEKATVHGAIEFSSKGGNMNSIQAKGRLPWCMATWWKSPVRIFGEALSNYIPGLGHLINYKISRADCDFSIEKGYVRTSNFVAQGSNMSLEGEAGYAFPICRSIQISSWGFAVCRGLLLPRFSCWPEGCFKCGERGL